MTRIVKPIIWVNEDDDSLHALTDWFNGNDAPVMEGVYERLTHIGPVWSVWADGRWYAAGDSIEEALTYAGRGDLTYLQDRPWRGLSAPPEGGYGAKERRRRHHHAERGMRK